MSITPPINSRGPTLDLTLPASENAIDIVARNTTTGKQLTLNLPAEYDGDDLTLDWRKRTIVDQDGVDRSSLLDPENKELWLATEPLAGGVANAVEVEAVHAGSAGPANFGTEEEAGEGKGWLFIGNATGGSNNTYTVNEPEGGTSKYLVLTNPSGLSVPEGAEILGIVVEPERRGKGGTIKDAAFRIVKGGAIGEADRAKEAGWPESDAYAAYGSATDLWGQEWTSSDFGEGFGIAIRVEGSGEAGIDHVRATVFFNYAGTSYTAKATLRWEKGYS